MTCALDRAPRLGAFDFPHIFCSLVRTVENTHWHQPLFLTFDSETMPEWFGMPNDADLPSTFKIEFIRAWRKAH